MCVSLCVYNINLKALCVSFMLMNMCTWLPRFVMKHESESAKKQTEEEEVFSDSFNLISLASLFLEGGLWLVSLRERELSVLCAAVNEGKLKCFQNGKLIYYWALVLSVWEGGVGRTPGNGDERFWVLRFGFMPWCFNAVYIILQKLL
jgi:hypothetical protein